MENKNIDGEGVVIKEKSTLTCGIACDLMPLVADGVASEDSESALRRHIEQCESCREMFAEWHGTEQAKDMPLPNDQKIMAYVRRQAVLLIGFVAVLGAAVGIMMLQTSLTFQNLLIMPIVGALSYCCFKKKGFFISAAVFLLTTVRGLVQWQTFSIYLDKSGEPYDSILSNAVIYGIILGVLALVGTVIAVLLDFAFRKEE